MTSLLSFLSTWHAVPWNHLFSHIFPASNIRVFVPRPAAATAAHQPLHNACFYIGGEYAVASNMSQIRLYSLLCCCSAFCYSQSSQLIACHLRYSSDAPNVASWGYRHWQYLCRLQTASLLVKYRRRNRRRRVLLICCLADIYVILLYLVILLCCRCYVCVIWCLYRCYVCWNTYPLHLWPATLIYHFVSNRKQVKMDSHGYLNQELLSARNIDYPHT